MTKLLVLLAVCLVLAYISEQNTRAILASGHRYSVRSDWAYMLLLVVLILFAGLRTSYNDTWSYKNAFRSAPGLPEFLLSPEAWEPFKNPLFYFFQSCLKSITDNPQWLFLTTSAITQACLLRFFKRYSEHFAFSVFIYFALGTFTFTLAAMKQVAAMAILTLAFPYLEQRRWGAYYLIVAVAMLVHTYAIAFAVLPFFSSRPWRLFTFLFVATMVVLMFNFEETITAFMEQANDLGKTLADYEVFDDHTINLFRLAVYAVPPFVSFLFQRWILRGSSRMDNILIHMSIISLAFMSMGTQSGANMFARMATYFEMGTICVLPGMLKKTFEDQSYRLVSTIAVVCFLGFFLYANLGFDANYSSTGLLSLF